MYDNINYLVFMHKFLIDVSLNKNLLGLKEANSRRSLTTENN